MSSEIPLLLNTHIEKAAGTSLLQFIGSRAFAPQETFIYRPLTDTFNRFDELQAVPESRAKKLIKRLLIQTSVFPYIKEYLPTRKNTFTHYSSDYVFSLDRAAKHGHFIASKFDQAITKPHFRTIVLRDPLERMKSHFRYLKTIIGPINQRTAIRIDPKMTFRDFAFDTRLINWQSQAVAGKRLADFDLVGISEKLSLFEYELGRRLCISDTSTQLSVAHLNASMYYLNDVQTDSKFESYFKATHAEDYQLYAQQAG